MQHPPPQVIAPIDSNIATRALRLPDIQTVILDQCDASTCHALRQVDSSWREATQGPRGWNRLYGPAHIRHRSCLVLSPARPKAHGEMQLFYEPAQRPRARVIGTYAGQTWRLLLGAPATRPRSPKAIAMLAKVARMNRPGVLSEFWRRHAYPASARGARRRERAQSYAFMQDRLHRLHQGLPIAVWGRCQTESACAFVLWAAAMTVCNVAVTVACFELFAPMRPPVSESRFAHWSPQAVHGLCAGVIVGSFVAAVAISWYWGDNDLYNIIAAPIVHQRLNLWARHLPELERAYAVDARRLRSSSAKKVHRAG